MPNTPDRTRITFAKPRAELVAFFVALFVTAIVLGGALAHALALPNKIGMSPEDYFASQQAYRGWNQMAWLLLIQFISLTALIVWYRNERRTLMPICVTLASLFAAQIVFWAWTFPANVATENWSYIPDNWMSLRRNWEYSHALGAAFQLVGMASLILAVLRRV